MVSTYEGTLTADTIKGTITMEGGNGTPRDWVATKKK